MADISTWSPTDESNTAAPPAGWPENMQPSAVNNSARGMMGAIRRWYDTVTAQLASLTASLGNYVLKSGDTMTGNLTAVDLVATHNIWASSGAVGASYIHSTGSILADGNINAWDITAGGTVTAAQLTSTGNINASADISARDIFVRDVNSGRNIGATGTVAAAQLTSTANISAAGTVQAAQLISTGNISVAGTVQAAQLISTANINASADIAGRDIFIRDVNSSRNIGATGTVAAAYIQSTGHIDAGTYVYAPDGFWAHDAAGGTTYRMYSSGGFSYLQFANLYAFQWSGSSGALNYIAAGDIQWVMRTGDFLTYNALAPVGGLGAYINMSDRRGKTDIVPSTRGLDEILRLSPVSFQRVSRVVDQTGMDRKELGFVAQDVQDVLPEAVRVVGFTLPDGTGGLEDVEPSLGITDSTITAVLVNAVKELNTRLAALEGTG